MATLTPGKGRIRAALGTRPVFAKGPALPRKIGMEASAPRITAQSCLEAPFRPSRAELVSFLVNGLYLVGKHRILEWAPSPEEASGLAASLNALGHRVLVASPGQAAAEGTPPGAFDRAMLVSRAFGYADGRAGGTDWLKAMRRALAPGGLLYFHVLDRDRAWSLTRSFLSEAAGADGRADIAFDPRSGMVTARLRRKGIPGETGTGGGGKASVKAFHLAEVETMLRDAGLNLERAYGDWQGGALESAGERTGRILVVASKPRRG